MRKLKRKCKAKHTAENIMFNVTGDYKYIPFGLYKFCEPIDLVRKWKNNPRINKPAIPGVMKSIQQFGFRKPVVLDQNSELRAGHTATAAAVKLGMKMIPVAQSAFSSPANSAGYAVADNKLGELAQWDNEELGNLMKVHDFKGLDLDLGFTGGELIKLTGGKDGLIDDDEIPDVKAAVCKLGDLWLLGKHRLLCGDCLQESNIKKLMNGKKADMVFTDPPYGINYSYEQTGRGRITGKEGKEIHKKIINDNLKNIIDFYYKIFSIFNLYTVKNWSGYVFYSDSKTLDILTALQKSKIKLGQILIWKKQSLNISYFKYQYIHEPILFIGISSNVKPYGVWYGKSSEVTVIECNKETKGKLHPTIKPIELCKNLICNSSTNNNIILDPFLGSGSTLIACEKTDRTCYGMEIDPHYCDVIIKRYEDFTGKTARKL